MKTQAIIVVKKPRRAHHHAHGGAWKVAYADFVTALMAFFLVMWLVGQSKAVRQAVAGYFKDPGIFDQAKSDGPIAGGQAGLEPDLTPPRADSFPLASNKAALERTAGRLKQMIDLAPEFRRLQKQIEIHMTPEGLRIELLEASDDTFFDTGSAVLKGDSRQLLAAIARELAKLENSVIIEGHTDSRPYTKSRDYTNWELSSDRANAARRVMGPVLRDGQVKGVRGFADTRLRMTDPLDPRNRRVSIIVQNLGSNDTASVVTPRAVLPHTAAAGEAGPVPAGAP